MVYIIVDARTLGSQPSGVGMYLYDFLKELIKEEELHIRLITDVAESEQLQYMQNQNIIIYKFGKRVFRSIGVYPYFKFVKKVLCLEQPDIFWEPNNLIPIKMKGFSGKIVLTIHDLFPMVTPKYYSLIYRIYFRQGVKRTIEMSDALLFDSNETKCQVYKYFPLSEYKKTFVSYLIIRELGDRNIKNDGYFLYIGNLEERKGSDLLLKAYARYCQEGGTQSLYLGGQVRDRSIQIIMDEMLERYSTLHYLGYISQDEKEKWLANCSCFVFPSRAEGFGIPPLEAMWYKKRIITSNLTIFNEILGGKVEMFDIDAEEEEQILNLSNIMLEAPSVLETEVSYLEVLNRYNSQKLARDLKQFLLYVEEKVEDSI